MSPGDRWIMFSVTLTVNLDIRLQGRDRFPVWQLRRPYPPSFRCRSGTFNVETARVGLSLATNVQVFLLACG